MKKVITILIVLVAAKILISCSTRENDEFILRYEDQLIEKVTNYKFVKFEIVETYTLLDELKYNINRIDVGLFNSKENELKNQIKAAEETINNPPTELTSANDKLIFNNVDGLIEINKEYVKDLKMKLKEHNDKLYPLKKQLQELEKNPELNKIFWVKYTHTFQGNNKMYKVLITETYRRAIGENAFIVEGLYVGEITEAINFKYKKRNN
jgi:predicted RNase H-like nuclease (RuvC/YqgF family)